MTVTFKKAPLVEMIAELRWGEAQPVQPNVPTIMHGMGADLDQFFMSFGGEVYQHGFRRAERLVPPGFPVFPFQPVYRYRRESSDDTAVLFQVGSGLFSANAMPPYRSWKNVSPTVKTGVDSLLKVRLTGEKDKTFSLLSLRYINAFGPELTEGRSIAPFMREILGFELGFPQVIVEQVDPGSSITPQIQFKVPLVGGASLAFLVGEGAINNEPKIIVDMTVTNTQPIFPDADAIMAAFTTARDVIHHVFLRLIKPIETLLQPDGDESDS